MTTASCRQCGQVFTSICEVDHCQSCQRVAAVVESEQRSLFGGGGTDDGGRRMDHEPEDASRSAAGGESATRVRDAGAPALHVLHGDNVAALEGIAAGEVDLIYIDPPFNTGKTQRRQQIRAVQSATASRVGFQGRRYRTSVVGTREYSDYFTDYIAFLEPRLVEAYRVLAPHGSLYLHVDYREVHRCRFLLDEIFGPDNFVNEIIWAYDFGGRPKDRWPAKHDNILFYVKDRARYTFNRDAVERIPYMAPGLVGPDKAARGKLPTDTWWHTIVPTNGREKTGYPTQKPAGILRRIVAASSNPGGPGAGLLRRKRNHGRRRPRDGPAGHSRRFQPRGDRSNAAPIRAPGPGAMDDSVRRIVDQGVRLMANPGQRLRMADVERYRSGSKVHSVGSGDCRPLGSSAGSRRVSGPGA